MIATSRGGTALGFRVVVFDVRDDYRDSVKKVVLALDLLRVVDYRRFVNASRLMPTIVIRAGSFSEYWYVTRTCVLSSALVNYSSPGLLASVIVHELTHARISTRLPWIDDDYDARVEALCVKEQVRFVERLDPDEYPGRKKYVAFLESSLSAPWWGKANRQERQRHILETHGFDSRIVNWLVRAPYTSADTHFRPPVDT